LPPNLHFRHHELVKTPAKPKKSTTENEEWKAAYHVAFNRRGTYLACGYGSGTVAVFNTLSRTLSALYQSDDANVSPMNPGEGVTSVTWSRRSRTLLSGAAGETTAYLWDNSHPFGPDETAKGLEVSCDADDDAVSPRNSGKKKENNSRFVLPFHSLEQTANTSFVDVNMDYCFSKERRSLETIEIEMGSSMFKIPREEPRTKPIVKHPCVSFNFPLAVGGSLQVNPHISTGGLAALSNGSLYLFWNPSASFCSSDESSDGPKTVLIPLWNNPKHVLTCAAFGRCGNRVYAATKDGALLGFDVACIWEALVNQHDTLPKVEPHFQITIGGSTAWHLLVSRDGKYIVVNSSDGAIRLFNGQECWSKQVDKPVWIFQDLVSKVKFACCDISGDSEYIVGGANGDENKYELFVWNSTTGTLVDKLCGGSVQLYSIAYHPTRSFLAVATSDGLVDVWGCRINWTAFAPDFQALPMNVEYVEAEDEFDVDANGKYLSDMGNTNGDDNESEIVDVTTIEKVPVFASDSEDEEEVFTFATRVTSNGIRKRSIRDVDE
jgi:WD40 repeat protein